MPADPTPPPAAPAPTVGAISAEDRKTLEHGAREGSVSFSAVLAHEDRLAGHDDLFADIAQEQTMAAAEVRGILNRLDRLEGLVEEVARPGEVREITPGWWIWRCDICGRTGGQQNPQGTTELALRQHLGDTHPRTTGARVVPLDRSAGGGEGGAGSDGPDPSHATIPSVPWQVTATIPDLPPDLADALFDAVAHTVEEFADRWDLDLPDVKGEPAAPAPVPWDRLVEEGAAVVADALWGNGAGDFNDATGYEVRHESHAAALTMLNYLAERGLLTGVTNPPD